MTKQGYTHIIVPQNLHDQLKTLAQQNNLSISQLINQLINISINVSLNIGINTSINTTQLNQQKLSLLQAPNQQYSQKQAPNTPFSLSEGSLFEKEKVQWAGPELNRRPQPRKGCLRFAQLPSANVLTKLDDRPSFHKS